MVKYTISKWLNTAYWNFLFLCIAVERNQDCHADFRAPLESEHGDRSHLLLLTINY